MSNERHGGSTAVAWTLSGCGLLLFYVATVGPVGGLIRNGFIGYDPRSPWLFDMYRPIGWLAKWTSMEAPLERYISWWEDVLPDTGPRD